MKIDPLYLEEPMNSYASCLEKQQKLSALFASYATPDARYQKIIELGRTLPPYPPHLMTPDHIVSGCQSIVYLASTLENGRIQFQIHSEALISAGLAALLLAIYNDETPEAVLKCPPAFLDQLGIHASLTPGRSNGLSSMYLRMKQEALKYLLRTS